MPRSRLRLARRPGRRRAARGWPSTRSRSSVNVASSRVFGLTGSGRDVYGSRSTAPSGARAGPSRRSRKVCPGENGSLAIHPAGAISDQVPIDEGAPPADAPEISGILRLAGRQDRGDHGCRRRTSSSRAASLGCPLRHASVGHASRADRRRQPRAGSARAGSVRGSDNSSSGTIPRGACSAHAWLARSRSSRGVTCERRDAQGAEVSADCTTHVPIGTWVSPSAHESFPS